jgi:hypothetical protein
LFDNDSVAIERTARWEEPRTVATRPIGVLLSLLLALRVIFFW